MFFHTSLAAISSFANINRPVTFSLYNLNDVNIQLILEFKISSGKYHPLYQKHP